jgi:hypothetical protein
VLPIAVISSVLCGVDSAKIVSATFFVVSSSGSFASHFFFGHVGHVRSVTLALAASFASAARWVELPIASASFPTVVQ